jgi:2-C-methyl-D-erythritol 4-phosphate cytidylyltransferase
LAGGRVRVLPGPPSNIKVTLEADLAFAELLLHQQNREDA